MKALVLSIMVVACGSAPAPTVAPPVASGPPPIRCDGGRELSFSRKLPNGDLTTLNVRCDDERVTASAETIAASGDVESDAPPEVRERGGPVEIDHALFDRVWRGAFARATEQGCKRRRDRAATTALTLRDDHEKREITCYDLDATEIVEPLRAAVKLAPPPAPPIGDEKAQWPFKGEYWKDELRYYSAR